MNKKPCRKCGGPLPKTRYFTCKICDQVLPSECSFEGMPAMDFMEDVIKVRLFDKKCSRCKIVMPLHNFYQKPGHAPNPACKPCNLIRMKQEWAIKKEERLLHVGIKIA